MEAELSLQDARSMIDSGAVDQTIGNEDGSLTRESTNRDESGRFTSDSAPKFGLAAVEQEAGYSPLPDPSDPAVVEIPTLEEFVEAVGDQQSLDVFEPVKWTDNRTGDALEPNQTATVEQASAALAAREGEVSSYIEGMDLAELAGITDLARAEALKANPEHAEEFGLDPKQVEANGRKETADVPAPEAQAQQSTETGTAPLTSVIRSFPFQCCFRS